MGSHAVQESPEDSHQFHALSLLGTSQSQYLEFNFSQINFSASCINSLTLNTEAAWWTHLLLNALPSGHRRAQGLQGTPSPRHKQVWEKGDEGVETASPSREHGKQERLKPHKNRLTAPRSTRAAAPAFALKSPTASGRSALLSSPGPQTSCVPKEHKGLSSTNSQATGIKPKRSHKDH